MVLYQIDICEQGKTHTLMVFGANDIRRPAQFATIEAAKEAIRIINHYRTDSAYDGAEVIEIRNN